MAIASPRMIKPTQTIIKIKIILIPPLLEADPNAAAGSVKFDSKLEELREKVTDEVEATAEEDEDNEEEWNSEEEELLPVADSLFDLLLVAAEIDRAVEENCRERLGEAGERWAEVVAEESEMIVEGTEEIDSEWAAIEVWIGVSVTITIDDCGWGCEDSELENFRGKVEETNKISENKMKKNKNRKRNIELNENEKWKIMFQKRKENKNKENENKLKKIKKNNEENSKEKFVKLKIWCKSIFLFSISFYLNLFDYY